MSTPIQNLGLLADLAITPNLYQQYSIFISEIVSASSVKVVGDATSFFAVGDVVIIPLSDFEEEYEISFVTFASGATTLTFTTGSFDSTFLGLTLAKKLSLLNYLAENGVGDITTKMEGSTLFDFDSGMLKIEASNGGGYFSNFAGNGLFQSSHNIFWLKLFVGTKGNTPTLMFGGQVDLSDLDMNFLDQTLAFEGYGHMRELESFYAYEVQAPLGNLPRISGIKVHRFVASGNTVPGVKPIIYKPFAGGELRGVEVDTISFDTEAGLKLLEYSYPNRFRWDNGDWVTIANITDYDIADSALVKLYSKGGSANNLFIHLKAGNKNTLSRFPNYDSEKLVGIRLETSAEIGKSDVADEGKCLLQFDGGEETHLRPKFSYIIKRVGGTDTVLTTDINAGVVTDILAATNNELLIFSPDLFYGAKFDLVNTLGSGDLEFSYSTGVSTWQVFDFGTNGFLDNTNNFANAGTILWSNTPGWAKTFLAIAAESFTLTGYFIKIKRVAGSGTPAVSAIKRINRFVGSDESYIDVEADAEALSFTEQEDEILVKQNYDNSFTAGLWPTGINISTYLENVLNAAYYSAAKRNLAAADVSLPSATFNIWGRPPVPNYPSAPTAIYVDDTNGYIYAAVDGEIWRAQITTGEWVLFIATSFLYPVKYMYVDSGTLYVFFLEAPDGSDDGGASSFGVFIDGASAQKFNATTGESLGFNPSNIDFVSCQMVWRIGTVHNVAVNKNRLIGQNVRDTDGNLQNFGENILVPFPQTVTCGSNLNHNLIGADSLDHNNTPDNVIWKFRGTFGEDGENSGPYVNISSGIYAIATETAVSAPDEIYFKWSYYQQGNTFSDLTEPNTYGINFVDDAHAIEHFRFLGIFGNNNNKFNGYRYYNKNVQIISVAYDEANELLYTGWVSWLDTGDNTKSLAYISKFHQTQVKAWDKVWRFTGSYTDITSNINSATSQSAFGANGDILYFGMTAEKFRCFRSVLSNGSSDVAFEYWNGSSWTALLDTPDADLTEEVVTFTLPNDWATTSVNGTSAYWIRLRVTSFGSASNITDGRLLELVIWDSSSASENDRDLPVALCWNPAEDLGDGTLHVAIYNREISGADSLRMKYFVIYTSGIAKTTTGSNFEFGSNYLCNKMQFNPVDGKVYAIFEDRIEETQRAILVTATFDGSITLVSNGAPRNTEYLANALVVNPSSGALYGLTAPSAFVLWEYANSFIPRIEYAKYEAGTTLRKVLRDIAELLNFQTYIDPGRNIIMKPRASFGESFTFNWLNSERAEYRVKNWRHKYDSVTVNWENPLSGDRGSKLAVSQNKLQRSNLNVSNDLIQTEFFAKVVGANLLGYFSANRLMITNVRILPVLTLNVTDKFNFELPSNIVPISSSTEFVVIGLKFLRNRKMELEGIEV